MPGSCTLRGLAMCRYDPVHYGVPEGSYASNPDGSARIREHRAMVQALHKMGLRVVLDVVYNHTFAAGEPLGSRIARQHEVCVKMPASGHLQRVAHCSSACKA